ncbi:TolC family protein [Nitratifractor sp.]
MASRRVFLHRALLGSGLLLGLGGCAPVGPDFTGPGEAKLPKGWRKRRAKDPRLARWWKVYGDRRLDRLIEAAWRQNLDLKAAGLRILQARAALGISEGMAYPQLQQLSGSATISDDNRAPHSLRSGSLSFDLGWELDLWGKYARGTESARAQLYAAVASYDAILVSVLAEVARNYISYRTAQERIAYARRNIAIQEYVVRVTEIQFNSGNVSELDMQQARTQLHSTRGAVYELKLSKIRARNALAMLLGLNPTEVEGYLGRSRPADRLDRFAKRQNGTIQIEQGKGSILGSSLIPTPRFDPRRPIDAELITRRPDVRAAEYLAHSRSAQIGVAQADLYPSFSLLGSIQYGKTSLSLSKIGVVAGPSFAWNIFQYGRIKNHVRLQDALFEESLVQYNKTVLGAVHEVSYALDNYRYTLDQLRESEAAVRASVRAFNISIRQYNDGLVSYQRLLNSVEKLTRYQDQYARLKGALATQVALLYKALGGGWQIARGGRYLSEETVRRMKERTDWGKMLEREQVILPRGWGG